MAAAPIDEWIPRIEAGGDEIPNYVHPDYFTIKVYHGGYIEHEDSKYIGGTVSYYDNVDKDKMSLTEVDGMVRGIKSEYVGTRIDYWYSIGSEEDAMSKLNNDSDVIRMCCMVPEIRLVILYLDHFELVPGYEDLEDLFMYEDQIPNWGCSQAGSSGVIIEELPDSPRKPKSGVKIEEVLDSPKRHAEKVKPVTTPSKRYKLCANRKKAVPALPGVKINEAQDEVPTQASRALTVDPSDKGKKKMQMEELVEEDESEDDRWFQEEPENEVADDGWFQEELEDEVANRGEENYVEASDDDDSNDDDYNLAKDDDEYAGYGVDDDFLFDWLTESEVMSNPGEGPSVAGRG